MCVLGGVCGRIWREPAKNCCFSSQPGCEERGSCPGGAADMARHDKEMLVQVSPPPVLPEVWTAHLNNQPGPKQVKNNFDHIGRYRCIHSRPTARVRL